MTLPSLLRAAAAAIALGATTVAAQTAAPPAVPDTLGKVRAAKQINVAYSADSPPFSFTGEGNRPAGYSIDLCKRVIAHVGRAVGVPNLAVNWLAGPVAERLEMVRTGRADLDCANTTASLARMRSVDFSALVFLDAGGVMVRSGAPVAKLADLSGKSIGVQAGTTTEARLVESLELRRVDATVVKLADGNDGFAGLVSGTLDAFAGDRLKLAGLAAQAKDPNAFSMLPEDLSLEPFAFALPRHDSAFRLEVNRALSQVYASGDIDAIFRQWLGPFGRPTALIAAMYLLNTFPQ